MRNLGYFGLSDNLGQIEISKYKENNDKENTFYKQDKSKIVYK